MLSPLLLLGGIGMLAVGIAPIVYWRAKKKVGGSFFAVGGAFWLLAIVLKVALDLTITGALRQALAGYLPYIMFLVFWPLYYGLRTGLFECVLPYLGAWKAGIRNPSFEQAVAFGLGFGCSEAAVLGVISIVGVSSLLLNPSALAAMPTASASAIQVQSDNALLFSLAAIAERVFTLAVHLVSALLIFAALNTRKPAFLLEAFVLKAVLDSGAVVVFGMDMPPVEKAVAVEVPVVLLGMISMWAVMKLSVMGVFRNKTGA